MRRFLESKSNNKSQFRCMYCTNHKPKLFEIMVLKEKCIEFSWLFKYSQQSKIPWALYYCHNCNGISKYPID